MRKLTYQMMVSLDGYMEDPNRSLDWVRIDEELHTFVNDQQREIDTYLYGRRMYTLMSAYWPTADEDPSAPQFIIDFAHIWKDMPKVVFSKTLEQVAWNSRLVRENAAEEIAKLKAQPGKDLNVGGAELAAYCMQHGLIDDYQLFVNPVILGSGTRMLPVLDCTIPLSLVETRTFESGVVFLHYRRAEAG